MKQKNQALKEMEPLLRERFGSALSASVLDFAGARLAALCAENAGDSKAAKAITEADLYPCLSLYEGLQKNGVAAADALAFLDESWSRRSEKKAASMRAAMKFPGLYRLMPAMFRWVAQHQFGPEAGFAATYYDAGPGRVKFDMTKCLYCDVCRKYGCPELVPCFCHTDDVCNGNIHPRLCWNRTKIMGDGGDVCDFDLFVVEKK